MGQLVRYSLDPEYMLEYIHWNLEKGNTLSKAVLKHVMFGKGEFFTYLKNGLTESVVNQPRNIHVGSRVKEKMVDVLFEELTGFKNYICIFDDHEEDYKEEGNWELYNKIGVHYNKEMYYMIQSNEINKDIIMDCLKASDIIWHSLCIVSKYPYKKNKYQSISREELEDIARNAEMILLLAYDAEGYIIWKKTRD